MSDCGCDLCLIRARMENEATYAVEAEQRDAADRPTLPPETVYAESPEMARMARLGAELDRSIRVQFPMVRVDATTGAVTKVDDDAEFVLGEDAAPAGTKCENCDTQTPIECEVFWCIQCMHASWASRDGAYARRMYGTPED